MNCQPTAYSAAGNLLIPSAVLAASFLGSLHCVGMCGGLMAVICKNTADLFSYHLGRLIAYMAIGSIFGWLGHQLKIQSLPWLSQLTAIGMGLILILMGWQFSQHRSLHMQLPKPILAGLTFASSFLLKAKSRSGSLIIPWAVGLLSVLLPCGWLYSYAVSAAALQNPWSGAALMAIFWLGGIPALSIAPLFFRKLLRPVESWFPNVISVVLVILGIWTILQKFAMR